MPLNSKQILFLFAVLIILVSFGYYIYRISNPSHGIYQAAGQFTGFEDDSISIRGVFNSEGGNVPEDLSAPRDFTFRVGETTKIEREMINWPTTSEGWEALGESFDIKDLPRKTEQGSLDDLKSLFGLATVYIEAKFKMPVPDTQDPIASNVLYRIHLSPGLGSIPNQ